jgi:receptor protein-tyrosine kinase
MSTIEKALQKKKTTASENASMANNPESSIEASTPIQQNIQSGKVLNIDKENLIERGFVIDTGERKSTKEEFRQIKRKLLNNAFGSASRTLNHSNLIMVSSAKPNEGKTFVSINLALSIALEQDKTVLLVDADVLRPSVTRELGVEDTSGLVDYLNTDELDVSDIIFNTNIEKLKLIPAGSPHHLSNELLASEKMANLASELANRYPDRVVIFDCPPLLGITETLVLSNLMGQALLVVEESKTAITDIHNATENLSEDLALGIVLNKAIRSHKDMYGYYGYGYGAN